jgi:hypothetical protein
MTNTLFKEVSYSLSKLIQDIEMGELGLPDIQRPFVWPNTKVRDLFDSMYKGFPVGYLLFWVNAIADNQRHIGTGTRQKSPRLLIVDGQQRLTSLYAVLKGIPIVRDDFKQERIYIAFRPRDQKFEVADAAIRKDPEFIVDISQLWSGDTSRNRFVKDFLRRLREYHPVSETEEDQLSEAIDQLYDLQGYPFTALELSATVNEEQVAEVFVRINSKGTPLNQADFILTLMSVFWDTGRTELERFCRDARHPSTGGPSPYNYHIQPDPDQLLRVSVGLGFRRARLHHVYSILRGKDLETEEFSSERSVEQFAILKTAQEKALNLQNWHDFLKTVVRAGYRRGDMITSQIGLLYAYSLYLIGKSDFGVDDYLLRNVMARWFFMTALTGRYTSGAETRLEQDFGWLRDTSGPAGFAGLLDRIINDIFTDDYWTITLPNELATSSARSPSLSAYHAALILLDARALFSHIKVADLWDPAMHAHKSAVERHHLFPKGYLTRIGIRDKRDTNQIANYALVEWADNIDISDTAPHDYFARYAARFSAEEMDQMRFWHALPDGWENMEYPEFLAARRKGIAQVIQTGFKVLQR